MAKQTAANNKFLAAMKAWYERNGKMSISAKNNYMDISRIVNERGDADGIEAAFQRTYRNGEELEAHLIASGAIAAPAATYYKPDGTEYDDECEQCGETVYYELVDGMCHECAEKYEASELKAMLDFRAEIHALPKTSEPTPARHDDTGAMKDAAIQQVVALRAENEALKQQLAAARAALEAVLATTPLSMSQSLSENYAFGYNMALSRVQVIAQDALNK